MIAGWYYYGNTMETSTVTTKYQATIPLVIRKMLGIKQGDRVAFTVEDGQVKIRKSDEETDAYYRLLGATMSEWDSDEDDTLFKDL